VVDLDSYNLLDVQLGVRFGGMQIAGFVQNAPDDSYVTSNLFLSGGQLLPMFFSGITPAPIRQIIRDPDAVFGIRLTLLL